MQRQYRLRFQHDRFKSLVIIKKPLLRLFFIDVVRFFGLELVLEAFELIPEFGLRLLIP